MSSSKWLGFSRPLAYASTALTDPHITTTTKQTAADLKRVTFAPADKGSLSVNTYYPNPPRGAEVVLEPTVEIEPRLWKA